jgi:hypothetical protein
VFVGAEAMAIEIKYFDGGKGVLWRASGTLTGEDLLAANKEMFSRDIVAEPYHYGLFDSTAVTEVKISAVRMRENAMQDVSESRRMPNFVYAIYAKSDVTFGLGRMWEALVGESVWVTYTFGKRPEAVDWLKTQVGTKFGYQISLE